MKHKILVGLIAFGLATSVAALRAEDTKKEETKAPAETTTAKYIAACPSPCTFSVSGNDKKVVAAMLKEHAKTSHQMEMSEKDAENMIKETAIKK